MMWRRFAPVLLTLLLCAQARAGEVWVVPLEGAVGPASVDLVIRAIADAGAAGAEALVIRMDTPGGLDKSMRDLVKVILAAKVPVVTYVAPNGARAASAGTYIAYASHVAAMAPATNIGSSTPVSIAPQAPQSPMPQPGGPAGEDAPPAAAAGDAMTRKVVNDAVAYLQGLAELRGRNVEWAEATVREGANLRASEALEQNVIDLIAEDMNALLEALHGRKVEINGETRQLATQGATLHRVAVDWRHEILSIITDPSIAYGLLIIGVYGLILEFYNPGMIFPAVLGVICLLLGAYGLQMLPVNYAGVALIVLGIGLMVAEVMTPTVGVLGVGGVVAFVIGSVLLIDSEMPGYEIPYALIGAFAAVSAAISFFVVGAAVRARRRPVVTGTAAMLGNTAVALEDFDAEGTVRAFGEIWQAHTSAPLRAGEAVTITAIDGLTLTVTPQEN
jgi:membrane-bound serine protease (ClpP class)